MNLLEKVDFLMDKYGLNKRSLSINSNIPYTTIDNWYKRGYENLTLPTLKKLAQYFNTTLDYWILDEITDPNYGKTSGFKVEYEEMEHIKKYRSLDDFGRESVDLVLDREVKRVEQIGKLQKTLTNLENQCVVSSVPKRLLAYYGGIAAAGKSVGFEDILSGATIQVEDTPDSRYADYAIGVSGNSMEPTFYDGDIVYVKKAERLNIGDIGIFQKDNCIYIKEVGDGMLLSHNSDYVPLSGEGVYLLGKVIGKVEGDYKIIND